MSRKSDKSPDLFAAPPAKKAKALEIPPRIATAQTCGSVAGIPSACSGAQVCLADIKLRCGKALSSGVLSEAQSGLVRRMERQSDSALAELKAIRETAELLAVHGEIKAKGER